MTKSVRMFQWLLFAFWCAIGSSTVWAQKKQLQAVRITHAPRIDGHVEAGEWPEITPARDFVMFLPDNGKAAPAELATEVRIAYTDEALYVLAQMFDNEPNKILSEIAKRDDFGTADHFGVFINGFNDSQQDFRFFVSAAGVQADGFYTEANGEDFSWDGIWKSAAKINDKGWVVEMRIPYAALRFPKKDVQTWGINFYREVRRLRYQYTWNFIDTSVSNVATQFGELKDLKSLKTPTRLFFIPYLSDYTTCSAAQKTKNEPKGGMDIKYGLTDAFTLDAILIPDFGQTKFDNVELNLSPYEQQFAENRPFFTEGTELFSKGNLFYSRRIGQTPGISLADDETLLNRPSSIKLINALKVSGRTSGGLGIGVLNAITETTRVDVQNIQNGQVDRRLLAPLTNYGLVVFDQRFRKNSSVSWVNSMVLRNGDARDAWATAVVFDLNTQANTYSLTGDFKHSLIQGLDVQKRGFSTSVNLGENSGHYRFGLGGSYVSADFDTNDLGILFQNRYHSAYVNASWRTIQALEKFNSVSINQNNSILIDNLSGRLQDFQLNLSGNFVTKANDYYGGGFTVRPLPTDDFYEPRSPNRTLWLTQPANAAAWMYFSSNYNRRFALDVNPTFTQAQQYDRWAAAITVSPRYRFSDHLSLIYSIGYTHLNNNIGFADYDNGQPIMARRHRHTFNQTIQGKWAISNTMTVNVLGRHYWSYTDNQNLLTVNSHGGTDPYTLTALPLNSSYNAWNLDLLYTWWFTPGSQVTVMYRNYAALYTDQFSTNYQQGLQDLWNNQQLTHIFSVSMRYFLDYNLLKKQR